MSSPSDPLAAAFAEALALAAGADSDPASDAPRTIWKFGARGWSKDLAIGDWWIQATVPKGSRFLAFQAQHGVPTVWLEVPEQADAGSQKDAVTRYFSMVGTGHIFPPGGLYRGTVQIGPLVLHLYEKDAPAEDRPRG